MVRFNLYKTCLIQLQSGFLEMFRTETIYSGIIQDSIYLHQLIEQAFVKFKIYCGAVMDIRRREVLAERRIIDITTWPIDESEKMEEVKTS